MIALCIRQLCALSILCGAALSITPEGAVKRVMSVVCSVVLITAVVKNITRFDFANYSLQLAKNGERSYELSESGAEASERLNRLVIEGEYEAYILDKANDLGIDCASADVAVQWDTEGVWVPYSAQISCECGEQERGELGDIIEAELGIPAERQQWS